MANLRQNGSILGAKKPKTVIVLKIRYKIRYKTRYTRATNAAKIMACPRATLKLSEEYHMIRIKSPDWSVCHIIAYQTPSA